MKLNKKYQTPNAEITYLLDTKDGQFCEGHMRASIAEEIVHTALTRVLGEKKNFELIVNENMMFPIDAFVFDENEPIERGTTQKKKTSKATKDTKQSVK